MFILNRRFFLLDKSKDEGSYTLFRFRKVAFKKSLKKVTTAISLSDINHQFQEIAQQFETNLEADQDMKLCWQNLTENMKQALLFSYYHRQVKGNNFVANVEILDDWLSLEYFKTSHKHIRQQASWFNLPWLRTFFKAKSRLVCRHHIGLRFGNIHLVADVVAGRLVYSIHWDTHAPSKSIGQTLKHVVFDKIAS